jgi:quercetin dioxygenase-like cupin family protein
MTLTHLPWDGTPLDEAVLRARLHADGYDVWKWSDPVGADYQAHSHDLDECIWLLAGEMTFAALGRDVRLAAGDRLLLPKGTEHTARAGAAGATYLVGERRR